MPTIPYKNKEGKRLSGVTTIIGGNLGWSKDGLMYWAWAQGRDGKDFRETRDAAADAGTIAHYLIECDIKGEQPDKMKPPILGAVPELITKAENCLANFQHWKSQQAFQVITTEVHLVSEQYQFGATPDCVAMVNGKRSLFDWKTSNGVHEDYLIQVAAYRKIWEEIHPDQPIEGGIYLLRINKDDASWTNHYWADLEFAWEDFIRLLGLHNNKKNYKGKV